MNNEIKYIGFYDFPDRRGHRVSSLALIKKMDYISGAINKSGYDVHIVSPSWADENEKYKFKKSETFQVQPSKKLTFGPTFESKNKIENYFNIVLALVWLFCWLVKNTKRNEKILVYHAQWLSLPIRLAKAIRKFHLILEVEELYYTVWSNRRILNKWEKQLIKSADHYFAVSDILANKLGNKVIAIVYGDYTVCRSINKKVYNKKNIDIVYAGSIDSLRSAAINAVLCAELLPENYIIHILGSGDQCAVNKMKTTIDEVNRRCKRTAVIYHGVKTGKEFDDFLSNCDIAINTQKEGDYMNMAFPSKIISYMSHNLIVVSTRIKSIENSKLAEYIFFSKDDKPESLVESIKSINLNIQRNYVEVINNLDREFTISVKNIFSKSES